MSTSTTSTPASSKNMQVFGSTVNKNVFWTLVMCSAYGVADNLWSGTVFAAYLKLLYGDSNTAVGYVEASNGLAGLFTALPIGYLADKYPRSNICKAGSVVLVVTACLHAYILLWVGDEIPSSSRQDTCLFLFVGVMFLWGAGNGVVNGPLQALYADSIPVGDRSKYYVYLFAAYMLASTVGPALSIILFQIWGDDWELGELKNIMLVGMGMEIFAAVFLLTVDDEYALIEKEEEEEEKEEGEKEEEEKEEKPSEEDEEKKSSEEELGDSLAGYSNSLTAPGESPEAASAFAASALKARRRKIPYMLFSFDLLVSLGSGMTVKFFPLYFKDDANLSPTMVQVIYIAAPIIIVAISQAAQVVSKSLGRVQTILTVKALGLSFLYAIVFFNDYLTSRPALLIPFYLARTGLMNCTYPLAESILMDFVPKNERARWKSLESVGAFGWCGSALVGGYLADK